MENLDDVQVAYTEAMELIVGRSVSVIEADVSAEAVVWLDVATKSAAVEAVAGILDSCGVRLVAANPAVAGDDEERAFVFIGEVLVGVRFGVPVEDIEDDQPYSDADRAEMEEAVAQLTAWVIDRVAGAPDIEPSRSAKIQQLITSAFSASGVSDERVLDVARSRSFAMSHQITEEIRRRHQIAFSDRAEEIAESILAAQPKALTMNVTTLRPLVRDHLLALDHECATQRAGEPIVQVIKSKGRTSGQALF